VSAAALAHATGPPHGGASVLDVEREKLDVIGRMSSSVAHELKNPLATIVATTQSLLTFWTVPGLGRAGGAAAGPPGHSEQLHEDLELILAEAKRASEIVTTLLSFVKQQPSELRPVSLPGVMRRISVLLAHDLSLQNVTLVTPGAGADADEGSGPWVLGSENQLLQVLVNLVANAQQALTAARGAGTVRVAFTAVADDRVAILVDDDGPGVPREARERIFEPWFTTKSVTHGTGLGLPIVRSLVERHGGTIRVDDAPGGGARFVVELPRHTGAVTALVPDETRAARAEASAARVRLAADACVEPPHPTAEAAGPRVLIVDDEPGIRRIVGRFLRKCGYQVEEAGTGRAAVGALQVSPFDAVISDLRMPGFSGKDLFDHVRREHPELVSRFVLTSGDMLRKETQQFVQQADCLYLEKPYELTDLLAVLERICGAPREARARLTSVAGGRR
jgi:two-component system, NtrC family, sensor kinase